MKQPKKLTRRQKEVIANNGLAASEWAAISENDFCLKIINKNNGMTKNIDKLRRKK